MTMVDEPLAVLVDGHRLACRRAGKGEVVLLVHGITTYSFIWRRVLPLLVAAGYEVHPVPHRVVEEEDARGDVPDVDPHQAAALRDVPVDRRVGNVLNVQANIVAGEPPCPTGKYFPNNYFLNIYYTLWRIKVNVVAAAVPNFPKRSLTPKAVEGGTVVGWFSCCG